MDNDTNQNQEKDDTGIDSGGSAVATETKQQENKSEGIPENQENNDSFFDEFNLKNNFLSLFKNGEGIFVMFGGVIIPCLLLLATCFSLYERLTLLILKHPLESLIEILLVLSIPIGNYITWSNLVNCDYRAQIRRGILNGISIGTSIIASAICITALALKYPVTNLDGTLLNTTVIIFAAVFTLAAAVSIFLHFQVRNTRIVESGKLRATAIALMGVLLSVIGFSASEGREVAIKVTEHMAISEDPEKSQKGLETLRWLNPRKELNMECSNSKAGGIPGMFIKLDNGTLRQLFFQVTGEPFRDDNSENFSSMPDDYLSRHVVGQKIKGLSLHRSKMLGHINPKTISSTIYWNFVFKNKNYEAKEARVELGLPEGAVISGMTIWKDGDAQGTMYRPTGVNQAASRWTEVNHTAPGAVVDLGRGRALLHCYPVPAQGQMRAAVAITVPAKLHTIQEASLPLPRIIEGNFSMKGDHQLRMISSDKIGLKLDKVQQAEKRNGRYIITGHIDGKTISGAGVSVQVARAGSYGPVSVKDDQSKTPRYVVQTIKELPAKAPKRLYIVLDGSEAMKSELKKVKNVMKEISSEIDTSVILASKLKDKGNQVLPLAKALESISEKDCLGGQDNLEAVVKATELAGESDDGAVLWIHGPQPSFNKEIYIISPYQKKPSFFEMALDNGIMNSKEFFKHHGEIGPFRAIARSGSPASDLDRFLKKWTPGGHEFIVEYKNSENAQGELIADSIKVRELGTMYAKEKCALYLERGQLQKAVQEAVFHRIVTPVSIASTVLSGRKRTASSLAEGMHNRSVQLVDSGEQMNTVNQIRPRKILARAKSVRRSYGQSQTNLAMNHTRAARGLAQDLNRVPILQGATNGTIGPQIADASAIVGINTAGTVRVNNLANLEALLNIIASCVELVFLLYGGAAIISLLGDSSQGKATFFNLNGVPRCLLGCMCIVLGLASNGVVNWFYASARGANLFS